MNKILKIVLILTIFLGIAFVAKLFISGSESQKMPDQMTYSDNKLGICGEKPNCVSSFQQKEDTHYIGSITMRETLLLQIQEKLSEKGCTQEKIEVGYWYYKCRSSLFGFVDDVEVLYLAESETLHYRSSSRVGYSDMGANRKRVQEIIDYLKSFK